MNTQLKLNKKEELICKIKALPDADVYLLKIFISGMEAERSIKKADNYEQLSLFNN